MTKYIKSLFWLILVSILLCACDARNRTPWVIVTQTKSITVKLDRELDSFRFNEPADFRVLAIEFFDQNTIKDKMRVYLEYGGEKVELKQQYLPPNKVEVKDAIFNKKGDWKMVFEVGGTELSCPIEIK